MMKSFTIIAIASLFFAALSGVKADLGFAEADVLLWKHDDVLRMNTYGGDGHLVSSTPFPEFPITTQKVFSSIAPLTSTVYLAFVDHTPNGLSVQVGAISYLNKHVLYPLTTVVMDGWSDVDAIDHDTLSGATVLSARNGTLTCFLQVSLSSGRVWRSWCAEPYLSPTYPGVGSFSASIITDTISYGTPDAIDGLPFYDKLCTINIKNPGPFPTCQLDAELSTGTFIKILPIYDSPDVFLIGHAKAQPNVTVLVRTNPFSGQMQQIATYPYQSGQPIPTTAVSYYHPWREVVVTLWPEPAGLRLLAFDSKANGKGLVMDRALDAVAEGFEIAAVGVRLADVAPPVAAPVKASPVAPAPVAVMNPAGQVNPNNNGTGVAVGILIPIVIILAAVVGFFLWRFYKNKGYGNSPTGYENL